MKEQRRAIIMGATSGIGLEVAKVLTGKGWLVGIAGRRQELLQQIQRKHLNIVATEQIDVTKADATERLQTLIGKMGGMDLYFHSSGIGYQNTELELATIETNAIGVTAYSFSSGASSLVGCGSECGSYNNISLSASM